MTTTSERSGEIAGGTAHERARRLAGALAERGVTELILERGGGTRRLEARRTDLPGLLVEGPAVLRCGAPAALLHIEADRIAWRTGDERLAGRLSAC